eukprot:334710_1
MTTIITSISTSFSIKKNKVYLKRYIYIQKYIIIKITFISLRIGWLYPSHVQNLAATYFHLIFITTLFNTILFMYYKKYIQTSLDIGGLSPSHDKYLVTTYFPMILNTISKNYNNITGPTNAALTVVTSNIITNNCIIQRNGLIIYVDMFLISYVRNIIYII